jgi:hypothetical protein
MHRHEMRQSNIYLNMYIIEYYSFWKNRVLQLSQRVPIQEQPLLVITIVGNDVDWRCMDSHPTGEGGVTLPSLYLYVFPSLADHNASTFIGPSLHLHTSLRCLEAKM